MKQTIVELGWLLLGTLTCVCQDKPQTPAEQFQALRKEYHLSTSASRPLTDAERMQFIGKVYQHHFKVADKLVALAEQYPTDPVALDALLLALWQVNGTPWPVELVGEDTARRRAFDLLLRHHILSERLGELCERISYGFCQEYETFLRAVRSKNPHLQVHAVATLSLAQYLSGRVQRLELVRQQPAMARQFEALFGKEYIAQQMQRPTEPIMNEVAALLEEVIAKHGNATLPNGDVIAPRAQALLHEIRYLSVGKRAPDIVGEDQDGQRFRLSDYRGKVVLLDFWSYV